MKAIKIENITKMVKNPEEALLEGTTEYDVTEENWIFQEAKEQAQMWISRYQKKGYSNDWAKKQGISGDEDIFNKTIGIFGEYIIDGCLDQFTIPNNWAKPLYPRDDERGGRAFDFMINPRFTLEVKTIAPFAHYQKLIVDWASYLGSEYIIGVKLYLENGADIPYKVVKGEGWNWSLKFIEDVKMARLMGFLRKDELKNLSFKNYGHGPCKEQPFEQLHPMNEFWTMVLPYSNDARYHKRDTN